MTQQTSQWQVLITATSSGSNPAFVTESAYYQALGALQNLINQNPTFGASISRSNYGNTTS